MEFLREWGLLLLQDARFPSLVGLVVGEPVRGSWWAHPKGKEIFRAANDISDEPDVLTAKLVSEKVTFVHQELWEPLIAVGRAREPWQLSRLSAEAKSLLRRVDEEQEVRASGKPSKELELRLLVAAEEVHTDSGAHAVDLMTWDSFAKKANMRLPSISPAKARSQLEDLLSRMNAAFDAKGTLPW
jgi:hypothetical protein